MKKVFVLPPGEDWIVDRFAKEWNEDNPDISTRDPRAADVIWLLADWCWNQVPPSFLMARRILTTIHHIVPEKFGQTQLLEFQHRDGLTSAYHVPNKHTHDFIRPLTSKPIHVIPYWANQKIWNRHPTLTQADLRRKYSIPVDAHVIGSFQRDTEGAGISSGVFLPKLEKGPDLLGDYVDLIKVTKPSLHVVLAGWRRQYLISRLLAAHVPYTYVERPDQATINELYQTLDLYPVTARQEGGPQSLIECGLLNVLVVSRDVGIASQVLPPYAINDDVSLACPAIPRIDGLKLPQGYAPFRSLLESL